jgi:hypothetical protein
MQLPPLTYLDFSIPLVIDNTQVTAFRKCPRYWLYSYINHLRSSEGKSLPLVFGGAFAAGLEDYRRWRHHGATHATSFEYGCAAIVKSWGDNPHEFPARNKDPRSQIRCMEALKFYTEYYPFHDDILQPHQSAGGGFEFSFAVELLPEWGFPLHPSGEPFLYVGRIDMLGSWAKMPIINDEKTTTRIQSNWPQLWPIRHQFAGYVWALQKLGLGTHQVLVRGLGIHSKEFVPIEGGPYRFPDFLLTKFEDDLRDTVTTMLTCHECAEARSQHAALSEFNRNWGDACTSYNRVCHFSGVCFGDPANELSWLRSMPRDKWEPTATQTTPEEGKEIA